jgi:hypothetical protein
MHRIMLAVYTDSVLVAIMMRMTAPNHKDKIAAEQLDSCVHVQTCIHMWTGI